MRQIVNLNEGWMFSKVNSAWEMVDFPHTWNGYDGQDGGDDYFRGTCMYSKPVRRALLPKADRYYIEFQGTNSEATLYINRNEIAGHKGGYSTWRADITDALYGDEISTFLIKVDNKITEDMYPCEMDFPNYGGVYRDVNIICVNESHFDLDYHGSQGIKITPTVKGNNADVEIEVFTKNVTPEQKIICVIKSDMGEVIAAKELSAEESKAVVTIENVHLWNGVKDPYLYKAEAYITENNEILDNVSVNFGCRSYYLDAEKGFMLNGERYPLYAVARHQDRWVKGNALSADDMDEDMSLIRELGANAVRLAHYQHNQYFYDLCDKYGLVVWAEIPYINKHVPAAKESTRNQLKELIVQNYNHPSIIVWGLSNELSLADDYDDMTENHKYLNDLAHSLDKTRLTAIGSIASTAENDPFIRITDAAAYNLYYGWYGGSIEDNGPWLDNFHKLYPDMPIGVSEYGCESLDWHSGNPVAWDFTEEFHAHFHEELIKQLYTRDYLWIRICWNMFDYAADGRNEGGMPGQNRKGLVTIDRRYKKDAFYAYKAWLSDEPFVHIGGKRYMDRHEEVTKVTVYSNQPEVELFANGVSLGKQTSDVHFFYFDVPNTAGITLLKAVAGECEDTSKIHKVSRPNPAYIFKSDIM
ncbi:MAG: glycoside hydrolase family 2 protein [Oscillospiraceae bacterium]|nr:glycoside hydrolase family 2 protein [Oscillospiraceae bacterium]